MGFCPLRVRSKEDGITRPGSRYTPTESFLSSLSVDRFRGLTSEILDQQRSVVMLEILVLLAVQWIAPPTFSTSFPL